MTQESSEYVYQYGFSNMHAEAMYDTEARLVKAHKTLQVIRTHAASRQLDTGDMTLLDIGCSTGIMTNLYAQSFRKTVGIDIDDDAVAHAQQAFAGGSVDYLVRDSMRTGFPDDSFDVVTCTQIYEHVPDATVLLGEIYRVLKPGGFCYFAAGNRVKLIEAHYRLPLLSVIPKWMAHYYIRSAGKADSYYETHLSLWGLRRLVRKFEVTDYTRRIIADPETFHACDMIRPGSMKQRLSLAILDAAYWLCPTYIWILTKADLASAGISTSARS